MSKYDNTTLSNMTASELADVLENWNDLPNTIAMFEAISDRQIAAAKKLREQRDKIERLTDSLDRLKGELVAATLEDEK